MKAILVRPTAGEATLELGEIDAPILGASQVRIAVRSASVNRADLLTRAGTHVAAASAPGTLAAGLDAAGEVIEVGEDVTGIAPGDRVMTMVSGGLAEEVVVHAAMAIPLPTTWSWQEGAAAVIGLMTEHDALVTAGRMSAGDTVVIHAVGSGVGTQALQLARHLGGGLVIGTSRSSRALAKLEAMGLDELIIPGATNFANRVLELTGGKGADVIIDHVGGPYLQGNVHAAAVRGRMVSVGRLGGAEGMLNLEELARKRLELIGTTFRTRTPEEKAGVVARLRADVDLEAAAEPLRPIIDRSLPWTRALEAQEFMGRNEHFGKIVLDVN